MKIFFKKVLIIIGLVSAIATSVNAAADGTIVITGMVSDSIVVGFSNVSGESDAASRFVGADVALGTVLPGAAWGVVTKNIFVNTNAASGVKMTITDAASAAGVLQGAGVNVAVAYTLMGSGYTVGTDGSVSLCAAPNAGSTSVGDLVITTAVTAVDQLVGDYTVTLNVTLAAN